MQISYAHFQVFSSKRAYVQLCVYMAEKAYSTETLELFIVSNEVSNKGSGCIFRSPFQECLHAHSVFKRVCEKLVTTFPTALAFLYHCCPHLTDIDSYVESFSLPIVRFGFYGWSVFMSRLQWNPLTCIKIQRSQLELKYSEASVVSESGCPSPLPTIT